MNQPNPQKQYRNRLIAAVQGQQAEITGLKKSNAALICVVADIVNADGIAQHPKFAGLTRLASMPEIRRLAGTPDEAPATTTEQAKQPAATDDPTSPGAAPAPANTGVTPDAVTDLQNQNVALPEDKPLDNLQDVTAPVSGTDAAVPSAVFNGDIQTGTGDSTPMDPAGSGGWTGTPGSTNRSQSALGDPQERFVASMRLARLKIAHGLDQGEDLTLAETIAATAQPLSEINALSQQLSALAVQRQATRQPGQQQRHLVPQAAPRPEGQPQGITPSFAQQPGTLPGVTGSRDGEDEWAIGMDGIND